MKAENEPGHDFKHALGKSINQDIDYWNTNYN